MENTIETKLAKTTMSVTTLIIIMFLFLSHTYRTLPCSLLLLSSILYRRSLKFKDLNDLPTGIIFCRKQTLKYCPTVGLVGTICAVVNPHTPWLVMYCGSIPCNTVIGVILTFGSNFACPQANHENELALLSNVQQRIDK